MKTLVMTKLADRKNAVRNHPLTTHVMEELIYHAPRQRPVKLPLENFVSIKGYSRSSASHRDAQDASISETDSKDIEATRLDADRGCAIS